MILTHGVMRRFKFTVPQNIIKSKREKVIIYYAQIWVIYKKESNLSNTDVRCPNTLEAQSYIGIYKKVRNPEKRRILRQYKCRIYKWLLVLDLKTTKNSNYKFS